MASLAGPSVTACGNLLLVLGCDNASQYNARASSWCSYLCTAGGSVEIPILYLDYLLLQNHVV